MKPQQAPDWAVILAEIRATGLELLDIGRRLGVQITPRMVRYYSEGIQPMYHRGNAIIELWCERTQQTRSEAPMVDLVRGHRIARQATDESPRVQNLPKWPPPTAEKPAKRKYTRRERVVV